jgi:hypothetical protein
MATASSGPLILPVVDPFGVELVVALELLAQLPELPLTPAGTLMMLCVPAELLQLYAIVVFGVFGIRNIAATKTAIPLIRNNRFMFVIVT